MFNNSGYGSNNQQHANNAHGFGGMPKSVEDFESRVRGNGSGGVQATSECPYCSSEIQKRVVLDQHGRNLLVPVLDFQSHSESQLSDEVIEHLSLSLRYSTPDVNSATAEFQQLLRDQGPNSLMRRLGSKDAHALSKRDYMKLLKLFATMFFPADISLEFDFIPYNELDAYGDCQLRGRKCHVRLHPTLVKDFYGQIPRQYSGVLNGVSMSRLGTLLHEVCHAFLEYYMCRKCKQRNYRQLFFHGFAWQRIACWAKYAAEHSLRLQLDLGRFDAIRLHWRDMQVLPDIEELESWELHGLEGT